MRVILDMDGPNVEFLTEAEIEDAVYTAWRSDFRPPSVRSSSRSGGFMAYVRATIERP